MSLDQKIGRDRKAYRDCTMDVAGNVIGLFTTALKAYQTISAAVELGTERLMWDVLMRIERTRFEVWGRTLGFLDETTGEPTKDGVDARLDAIFQIEAARGLVQDILRSITTALQEFEKSASRYRLGPNNEPATVETPKNQGKSKRWKRVWSSTKDLTMHLILVVKDEDMVKDLLEKLTDLNDGLEKVLSLSQKTQAAKALVPGVLPKYSTSEDLQNLLGLSNQSRFKDLHISMPKDSDMVLRHHPGLVSTARVKQRCVELAGSSQDPEQTKRHTTGKRSDSSSPDDPASKSKHVGDFEVSIDALRIENVPRRNEREVQWPNGLAQYIVPDSGRQIQIPVLIEWRQQATISPGFKIPKRELELRRNLLVRLLHETSNSEGAADYRVLDCLGYCKSTGRVDGPGQPISLIGFIAKIPSWADGTKQPVSLQKLLRDSFHSDDARETPSLRARFQLARQITTALYQLQCSGWLHRNLSSDQVVFFYDRTSPADKGQLRLDAPFLTGLQYSRPDDQSPADYEIRSEGFDTGDPNWGRLGLYLHPDFSRRARRYQRSDDVYSLGVILLEIAFWEPVEIFRRGEFEPVPDVAARIIDSARAELAAEAGDFYRDAVLRCLEGLRGRIRKVWLEPSRRGRRMEDAEEDERGEYQGKYTDEDPEYGLERDLMWKVLREIEKCIV